MDARKEQRQNAEIHRRKSKLDEMATLSRIEERMEEEEGELMMKKLKDKNTSRNV